MNEWEKLQLKLNGAYDSLNLNGLKRFEDDRKASLSSFQTKDVQDKIMKSAVQGLYK